MFAGYRARRTLRLFVSLVYALVLGIWCWETALIEVVDAHDTSAECEDEGDGGLGGGGLVRDEHRRGPATNVDLVGRERRPADRDVVGSIDHPELVTADIAGHVRPRQRPGACQGPRKLEGQRGNAFEAHTESGSHNGTFATT